MKKGLALMILTASLLAACSEQKTQSSHTEMQEMVGVTFETPEQLAVGQTVLTVKVIQGDQAAETETTVKFEVWQAGDAQQAQQIDAKHVGGGIYEANYTFAEDAAYYVIAHTTANGVHTMPKQRFLVGDVDVDSIEDDDYTGTMSNH